MGSAKAPHKSVGELRQDFITGKWALIAAGRAKRPHKKDVAEKIKDKVKYQQDCPFCNLAEYPQEPDIFRIPDDQDKWLFHIFPNKFPALTPVVEFKAWAKGPYRVTEAIGYHELLAPRWHHWHETNMSLAHITLELEALVLRFRQLRTQASVSYIQMMKNYGAEAGGSLEHPHYQIFTTPIIPSDVQDLLRGADDYWEKNGKNAFEAMLEFERHDGGRVIWENEYATVFCPFAPRVPHEIWVMPRQHESRFENTSPKEREATAEAVGQALHRLKEAFQDPSYNLIIYSAPCDDSGWTGKPSTFEQFRWHIQILPRQNVWGGFELGTGLEIVAAMPEESAEKMRAIKLNHIKENL
jgi:UDPglucose--hexose-1-phosphate uridylyltransferase